MRSYSAFRVGGWVTTDGRLCDNGVIAEDARRSPNRTSAAGRKRPLGVPVWLLKHWVLRGYVLQRLEYCCGALA